MNAMNQLDNTLVVQSDVSAGILRNANTMQYLTGLSAGDLNGKSLIHVAASSNNPSLLDTLITYCGLPLNAVVNKQWEQVYAEGTIKLISTPLSLVISNLMINDMVNLLVNKQSSGNYLTHVYLSYSKMTHLSEELFKLQHISHLDASHNKLKDLPFSELTPLPPSLYDINLSYNSLTSLPIEIFTLQNLTRLDASHNPLVTLPETWWLSNSLIDIDLSHTQLSKICHPNLTQSIMVKSNSSRQRIPSRSVVLTEFDKSIAYVGFQKEVSQLNHLNISNCCIEEFPRCFACFFPKLEYLNISYNKIKSCCTINELPASLRELNVSHNKLCSKDHVVFCLSSDRNNCFCHNVGSIQANDTLRCIHMRHSKLAHLEYLNLSNNANLAKVILNNASVSQGDSAKVVELFFPKLKKLFLNNCGLMQCPAHLDKMPEICSLHIGDNKCRIPLEISKLERLFNFAYEGLTDPLVSVLNQLQTVEEKKKILTEKW